MGSISSTENHQNLTQYETVALDSELNLSDGHPRQDLTEQQRQIVESLSDMWMQSFKHPASTIEREAAEAFFSLFGQKSHLDSHDEIVACYSSSVAMEIFARALSQQGSSIALLHPTFDNIPDILRGNRLNLVAIDEEDCHRQQALSEELLNKVDAVFLTTPNNPTGRYISAVLLDRIARQCAASDTILALDTCFRGFDIRTHYDHYAILRESGSRWVVIEDTGKLWPTLELKVGWLSWSSNVGIPLRRVYSDILLAVSPVILMLVRKLADDAMAGGMERLHWSIAENRKALRETLSGIDGVSFPDSDSRVSVERIEFASIDAAAVWRLLRDRNIYVLPCRMFHWDRPEEGNNMIRVALSRPLGKVLRGAEAIREVVAELQ
jgi:enduracididine biosynthesis enzyme MppP